MLRQRIDRGIVWVKSNRIKKHGRFQGRGTATGDEVTDSGLSQAAHTIEKNGVCGLAG